MSIYMKIQRNDKVLEMHHKIKEILAERGMLKSTPSVISDFLELQTMQDTSE